VKAVVEGVGDHGCEYMTGGAVAVLGDFGRNFAAGMSGGIAYVYDPDDRLRRTANTEMVTLHDELEETDRRLLRRLVENHREYTDSARAAELLDDWEASLAAFTKVMPDAYAEVIAERSRDDVRENLPPAAAARAAGDDGGAAAVSDD
jgi:glutamate synthase (NADPH/NADH) large chain